MLKSMKRWQKYSTTVAAATLLMAMPIGPARATGPPETVVEDEFEFGEDVNPCTGETHTIFVSLTDRRHVFETPAGRGHANLIGVFHVRTSDGFAGDIVSPNTINLVEDGEDSVTITVILVGVISNPGTGQRYLFHQRAHITVVNGKLILENFALNQTCLGGKAA